MKKLKLTESEYQGAIFKEPGIENKLKRVFADIKNKKNIVIKGALITAGLFLWGNALVGVFTPQNNEPTYVMSADGSIVLANKDVNNMIASTFEEGSSDLSEKVLVSSGTAVPNHFLPLKDDSGEKIEYLKPVITTFPKDLLGETSDTGLSIFGANHLSTLIMEKNNGTAEVWNSLDYDEATNRRLSKNMIKSGALTVPYDNCNFTSGFDMVNSGYGFQYFHLDGAEIIFELPKEMEAKGGRIIVIYDKNLYNQIIGVRCISTLEASEYFEGLENGGYPLPMDPEENSLASLTEVQRSTGENILESLGVSVDIELVSKGRSY